jgi:CheY-like chemotaxis protein
MDTLKAVTILLVEDDPGDQKLVKKSLDRDKIANELHIANSGEEALEYLQRSKSGSSDAPMPELILLDLNMPGMGGQEFLKHLKSDDQLDTIPVVILTTSDSDKDVLETFKLHAAGYVKKPGSLSEFKDVMQNISEYWFVICKRVKHASEYPSRDKMCTISR